MFWNILFLILGFILGYSACFLLTLDTYRKRINEAEFDISRFNDVLTQSNDLSHKQ